MVQEMARYSIFVHARLDPIAYGALTQLAYAWEAFNDDGRPNISEVVRRALVYSYLVYIEGIDPVKASTDLEEYIEQKLIELGLEAGKGRRRKKRRRTVSSRALVR